MGKFEPKDITGQRYGKLVAVCRMSKTRNGGYKWLCKCDCGNDTIVDIGNLRNNGGTQSCGCNKKQDNISIQEYEDRKREEFAALTNAWKYISCCDRDKGKHIIRCVFCDTERKVNKLTDVPVCNTCLRNQKKQIEEESKYKLCTICGSRFKPIRSTAIYCGVKCSNLAYRIRHADEVRERRKIHKRLREAKATVNGKVDYSITLSKLIEKDNHICKLCGREVNESDYVYIGDVFIAGNDYPSIDHIKPLSKGGVHQWSNVQLAHRLCNSIKQANEN